MTILHRREFLRRLGGAVLYPSLVGLAACSDRSILNPRLGSRPRLPEAPPGRGGYGDLLPSVDSPELLIPAGFTCVALSETLAPSRADPGFIVPQAFDGMASFALPDGRIRLIRNHEMRDSPTATRPIGMNPYDPRGGGGTTSLEVEVVRGSGGEVLGVELTREYVSLSGTHVNCAGGPTPWGSWLTCEETTEGVAQGRLREHGYIFEVPVSATEPIDAVPYRAMGRFVHEAVALDPVTGFVYETEDFSFDPNEPDHYPGAGFYRFIPATDRDLSAGGRLQMLAVEGRPRYNTARDQTPGTILPVTWVDIDDPDPANAAVDPSAVFRQGLAGGGAIFQRLEGCWYGDGSIFFNATSGGNAGAGQVWQYRPIGGREDQLRGSAGQLVLVFESPSRAILNSPDNLCVSPRGGLVLCEDSGGVQFIRGLTRAGEIFNFVKTAGNSPEFCGATFSPSGDVLFFNTQGSVNRTGSWKGRTYAIWGPWSAGAL